MDRYLIINYLNAQCDNEDDYWDDQGEYQYEIYYTSHIII